MNNFQVTPTDMSETIQTWKAKNRKGDVISKRYYDHLSKFILGKLKNTEGISLVDLIEQANEELPKDFGASISCLLLIVKNDLEVMGLITIEKLPDRTQFISLKKRSGGKVNYMDKLGVYHTILTGATTMENKNKKMSDRIEKLIKLFNRSQYSSISGLNRDRYYYIQKKEELMLLEEEVQKATERIKVLNDRINATHLDVFLNWRNDLRILSKLEISVPEEDTTPLMPHKTIL